MTGRMPTRSQLHGMQHSRHGQVLLHKHWHWQVLLQKHPQFLLQRHLLAVDLPSALVDLLSADPL